jgi:hypothetical protein
MMEKAESSSGLDLSLCPNALEFPPFSPPALTILSVTTAFSLPVGIFISFP